MKRLLLLVILVSAILRSHGITRPWSYGDHNGWGGAFYSNIARNYLRYGYASTHLAPVVNTGEVSPHQRVYYLTHPPSIGLAVSLAFGLFGEHEWAARLVPLLFSVACIPLIYRLGSALWSPEVGLLAAAFASFVPMEIVYGSHVDPQGGPVLFFSLALLESYRQGRKKTAWGALIVGSSFDWPVHYMTGLIAAHHIAFPDPKRRWARYLPIVSVALVLSFALYGRTVAPRPEQRYLGADLGQAFLFWTGAQMTEYQRPGHPITPPTGAEWARRVGGYYKELFTLPLLALALVGLGASRSRERIAFWGLLLTWGIIHVALFPIGAFVHDYWSTYLTPGLCLSAAAGLGWMSERLSRGAVGLRRRWLLSGTALSVLACYSVVTGWERIDRQSGSPATLGKKLRDITPPEAGILSLLPLDVRDAYYADRYIRDGVNNYALFETAMADPDSSYRYFVVPHEILLAHPRKPLFVYLSSRCPHEVFEDVFLFDLSLRQDLPGDIAERPESDDSPGLKRLEVEG